MLVSTTASRPETHRAEILSLEHVRKTYSRSSRETEAIADLDFCVYEDEFVSIVGPSGCGKTTLLRLIAGLMAPTSGTVKLFGEPVSDTVDDLVLVFQDYSRSLCPWRNAERNVALALERVSISREEKRHRIATALGTVGLSSFAHHYPWEMSGGMQQRLQIARAIAYHPRILLMDEPFGSLDALTRFELEDSLLQLWASSPKTILFVTHDIDEAIYLSDRVIVVSPRPSRVQAEFAIELDRPRDQIESRNHPEFGRLRAEIMRLIGAAH